MFPLMEFLAMRYPSRKEWVMENPAYRVDRKFTWATNLIPVGIGQGFRVMGTKALLVHPVCELR